MPKRSFDAIPIGHNPVEAPKKVARVNREKVLSLEAKSQAANARFEAELEETGSVFNVGQTIERIDSLGIPHSWKIESQDTKGNLVLKREDDDIYEESAKRTDLALEQKALEINETTGVSALTEVENRLKALAPEIKKYTGKDSAYFNALGLLDIAKELVRAKATGKLKEFTLDEKILQTVRDEIRTERELSDNGEEIVKQTDAEKARLEIQKLKDLSEGAMMDDREHARLQEYLETLASTAKSDKISADEYPVLADVATSKDKRAEVKRIPAENIPDLESELEELPDDAIEGLQDEPTVAEQSPNPKLSADQLDALAVKARAKRKTAQEVRRAVSAREEAARNELAAKRALDDRAEKVAAGDFLSLEENLKDLKNAESINDRADYSKGEEQLIGDDFDGDFFAKEPVKLSTDAIQALESPTPAFWAISESVPGDNRDYKDFIEQFEELRQAGQLKDYYGNEITLKRVQEAKKSMLFDWAWNRKHRADSIRYLRETIRKAMEKGVPLEDQPQAEMPEMVTPEVETLENEKPAAISSLRARLGKWGGRVLAGLGLMTQIENDTPQRPEPTTRERIVNVAELPSTRQEVTAIDLEESPITASQVDNDPKDWTKTRTARKSSPVKIKQVRGGTSARKSLLTGTPEPIELANELQDDTTLRLAEGVKTNITERNRSKVENARWRTGNELIKSIKDWTPESSIIELTGSEAEKLANNAESFGELLSALNELPGTAEFKKLSAAKQKIEIAKAMRNIDAMEKASRNSNLTKGEQRKLNKQLESTHDAWQTAYDNASSDVRASIEARAAEKAELERIKKALAEETE